MTDITTDRKWSAGHQPVANFHTGLIAKLYTVHRYKLPHWLFHDLDALDEPGSFYIEIPLPPKSALRTVKKIPLVAVSQKETKRFFDTGPYTTPIDLEKQLFESLETLGRDGGVQVPKPALRQVRLRVEAFCGFFKPGTEWKTVTAATHRANEIALSLMGGEHLFIPQTIYLSRLLGKPNARPELLKAYEQFGPEHFWRREGDERCDITEPCDLAALVEEKRLIPKALPLSYLMSALGYGLVRGMGEKRYESAARAAGLLPEVPMVTVTSRQGLPEPWRALAPEGFRPSALLLYLTGGHFDPSLIIEED